MRFRLTSRSMTLDDPELLEKKPQILSEFCWILQIWEATTAKQMKIDPYCQRQRCTATECSFQHYVPSVDMISSLGTFIHCTSCVYVGHTSRADLTRNA